MTRPFQYDNFVQSQIAVGTGNSGTLGSHPQSNHLLEASNGNQSRLSLKQKINQLLGLCKEQNEGIKTQFAQVIGAQKQILDLMKQQLNQPTGFNNYARSNVEMFPGTNQLASISPVAQNVGYHTYDGQNKPRSYQSFPLYKSGHSGYQSGHQPHLQNYGPQASQNIQQLRSQGTYPQGNYPSFLYSNQNIIENGNTPYYQSGQGIYSSQGGYAPQRFGSGQGNYYQPNQQYGQQINGKYIPGQGQYIPGHGQYIPGQSQYIPGQTGQGQYIPGQGQYIPGQQLYAPARTAPGQGQGHYSSQEPYVTEYAGTNAQQGGFGTGSGYHPNDRTNILRSKVHELKQENGKLRNLANQGQIPFVDDDPQTRFLQQQVLRLRNVIQDYENQLSSLNNNPKIPRKTQLLRELKDQGQKIRQDTIALLRNKSAPSGGFGIGSTGGNYGVGDLSTSGRRGIQNLNADQQAHLRSQLHELRIQCEQLQNQGANIKRLSKGTNFTGGSRRI